MRANVKLSGFSVFTIPDRAERAGRNSEIGEAMLTEPPRSITSSASHDLKAYVSGSK
jgi:nucleoid DNA-binding protein